MFYVLKVIKTRLNSIYYNNTLINYFGIQKTQELVAWWYYILIQRANINFSMKKCNICLVIKLVRYKPYDNL